MSARMALLTALISGKSYGLELIDKIKKSTNGVVSLGAGSVYPALRALEDEGLVRSFDADPSEERGGRPRRYYELTGEGRRAAREQKAAIMGLFELAEAI